MAAVLRWTLLATLALAAVLVPFWLYEGPLTAWTERMLESGLSRWALAGSIAALLAGDLLLPVPSSLVATAAGYLLGFVPGVAAVWAGMTAGALFGYWLGVRPARPLLRRLVGAAELARAERAHARWGDWAVVVCRSVPVLAEASVVFAGAAGMPLRRFVLLAGLSNLGVAAVYAGIGAYALAVDSFLLAFAAAVVLPGLAMGALRRRSLRR